MFIDANGKKWFKGNLHTHTTVSDGTYSPQKTARLYRDKGYDFLALTDHRIPSETKTTEDGLLLLSGCEYDNDCEDVISGLFHIVSIGAKQRCTLDYARPEKYTVQQIVDAIHESGAIAILAHPAWSMNTVEQIQSLSGLDAVEIYNSVSGAPHNSRPYSGEVIDLLAVRGVSFPCVAADDTHYAKEELCLSYTYVQADELSEDAIVNAIRNGRVMATQGPRFFHTVEDNGGEKLVHITCDPVEEICIQSGFVWHDTRIFRGHNLTECTVKLTARDRFIRPVFTDSDGKQGFSSPIYF